MRDAWVLGVGAEAVLLVVRGAEDVVAQALDGKNSENALKTEIDGVHGQVAGLDAVGEGHPYEVTKRQHHAEAVLDDVDGRENGGLHVQSVERVDGLCDGYEDDRVSHAAVVAVLLHDEGQVHDDPAEHTRAQLAPSFDVDLTKDWQRDARVELAADEPIVQHVAGMATSGKFTAIRVIGVLNSEGVNVDECGEEVGNQDIGGDDADIVVGDEGPDGELGALRDSASSEHTHNKDGREEGIELVLHLLASPQRNAGHFLSWKSSMKCQAKEVVAKSTNEALPVE